MTDMQYKKYGGKQSTNTFNDNKSYGNKSYGNKSYGNKSYGNESYNLRNKTNSARNFRKHHGEKFCVRISNIPQDLTIRELNDLMQEWGNIGKINFNNSVEYKAAFVDFYIKDEAEYFVKALDRTNFDNLILSVEMLNKFK
jgi:hypothetical protein